MVIQHILGGFGNQLNTYVCGYSIAKELGQELVLEVSDFTNLGYFRPYVMDKLNIPNHRKLVYPPQSNGFMDAGTVPEKYRTSDYCYVTTDNVNNRKQLIEHIKASGCPNVYIGGYGGLEFCTDDDKKDIRNLFHLKKTSDILRLFNERIKNTYSVAIHIRRTDFCGLDANESDDYFRAAIAYVKEQQPEAEFYFFSDDIDYVKKTFGNVDKFHYVHLLGGRDVDLDEFFCMAACNRRILSGSSTYGLWASFLSESIDKDITIRKDNIEYAPDKIYLDSEQIELYKKRYDFVPRETEYDNTIVGRAESLFCNDKYDDAIDLINEASLDSISVSKSDENILEMIKANSYAEKGGEYLNQALRSYYSMMQYMDDRYEFHDNYFKILYKAGRYIESALHAARACRMNGRTGYEDYYECFEGMTFAEDMFLSLVDSEPMHFMFLPIESWSFYLTYVKSVAIILARMGFKVTFWGVKTGIEVPNYKNTIEANIDIVKEVINTSLNRVLITADSVYNYHLDLFGCLVVNEKKSIVSEEIAVYSERLNMKTVLINSLPYLSGRIKDLKSNIKTIVPDFTDFSNRERLFLDNLDDYIDKSAACSDKLFVSDKKRFVDLRKKYGAKIFRAYPTITDPSPTIVEGDEAVIDITPNYLESDAMFVNALEILKASI